MTAAGAVLAVDPGRSKAGYALVDAAGVLVTAGIEPVEGLAAVLGALLSRHPAETIALGRGTNAREIRRRLEPLGLPIRLVDEYETTRRARSLYFADHPPRGWRRLVPLGLQLPPRPIDDYAAILIARRYLARGPGGKPPT